MIFCAVTGPTPGSASSCSSVALFRWTGPAGTEPAPAPAPAPVLATAADPRRGTTICSPSATRAAPTTLTYSFATATARAGAATRTGGGTAEWPGRSNVRPARASRITSTAAPARTRRRSSKASGMSPIVTTEPSRVCDTSMSRVELTDDQVHELARHDDRLPDLPTVQVRLHLGDSFARAIS